MTQVYDPFGHKIDVTGPWYTLVRDVIEGEPKASMWRLLATSDHEVAARIKAENYASSMEHDVQWQIAELRDGPLEGGVITLALSNGAMSEVRICERCAEVIGQGRAWMQVIGKATCAACEVDLI